MLTQTTTTQQWQHTYRTWLAGLKKTTAASYAGIHRLFFNHIDLEPWQVTADQARTWIAHLEVKERSPRTIYNHLAALASYYNAAQAAGLCQSNPIAGAMETYYRTYKPDGHHRHKSYPRKDRSQYQDAFLDDDGPSWLAAVLGLRGFVNAGCCVKYGTMPCLHCRLVSLIPRHDCSPPTDCPTCPQRTSCPCGDDDLRRRLQAQYQHTGEKRK